MKTTTAIKAITSVFSALNEAQDESDLKKLKLTLQEYFVARDIFNDLSTPGTKTKTFQKGVADFYGRHGFNVTPGTVNYTIDTI